MTWKSWFTWSTVTALLLLYVSAGSVASQTDVISVKLEPGYSTQLHVFRLAEDVLRMRLEFKVGDKPRPELGDHSTREDWRKTGLLKLINPGSAVRIAASTPNATPATYEAMPNSVVYPPAGGSRSNPWYFNLARCVAVASNQERACASTRSECREYRSRRRRTTARRRRR
jgi:hypothetical protein